MKNISANITYDEATRSNTASRKGIDNTPDATQLKAMKLVAKKIFQPVREHFGKPIRINSFFRSEKLNRAVGGSSRSSHCKGEAIDVSGTPYGLSNADIFHYIKDNLEFDQIIWEFGNDSEPQWVHLSYRKGNNRGIALKAVKINGKTRYVNYE